MPAMFVTALGLGMSFVPMTLGAVSGVDHQDTGMASALAAARRGRGAHTEGAAAGGRHDGRLQVALMACARRASSRATRTGPGRSSVTPSTA
jgi:hypothetical protein